MMIVYPDLGAHINAIDDRLAPHAQIGNQFIDGRDLIDFCAGWRAGAKWVLAVDANSL